MSVTLEQLFCDMTDEAARLYECHTHWIVEGKRELANREGLALSSLGHIFYMMNLQCVINEAERQLMTLEGFMIDYDPKWLDPTVPAFKKLLSRATMYDIAKTQTISAAIYWKLANE